MSVAQETLGSIMQWSATSADAPMFVKKTSWLVVGGALAISATSSGLPPSTESNYEIVGVTSAGLHAVGAASLSSAPPLLELRRRTGLTWEQVARLFGVSRRTVHFWASGKPATSNNEERLQRILTVVRMLDLGVPSQTRAALLASANDGASIFDALVVGNYNDAATAAAAVRMGAHTVSIRPTTTLDATESRRRSPSPPGVLADALSVREHETPGKLLAVKRLTKREK